MAKNSKPVDLMSKHLTDTEYMQRKEQEEKLKGSNDLVYTPPKHLSTANKKLYKTLVGQLKNSDILCDLDMIILENTVDSISRMRECNELITRDGITYENTKGDILKNPACQAYKDYNAIFNKCCQELGLSPSARARLAFGNLQSQLENEDPVNIALRGD